MKKWLIEHPYFSTSVIFLIILIIGWQVLYWPKSYFGFLLLLYFIVTLGIRLDDISKKIGSDLEKSFSAHVPKDTIANQLSDIRSTLRSVDITLKQLAQNSNKEDP
jgi:hypothetical protein